jgi:hypothetical protein
MDIFSDFVNSIPTFLVQFFSMYGSVSIVAYEAKSHPNNVLKLGMNCPGGQIITKKNRNGFLRL